MTKVKLLIRANSINKNIPVLIYARIWVGTEFDQTTRTRFLIHPEHWSQKKQCVRQKSDFQNKDQFNANLLKLKRHIEDSYNNIGDWAELDKHWLKRTVENFHNPSKSDNTPDLPSFIEKFMLDCQATKSNLTIKSYKSTLVRLNEFSSFWDRKLQFKNIDLDFHRSFMEFCANEKNMQDTTIGKHIKNIKLFVSEAKESGILVNEAYKSKRFYKPVNEAQTIYLTDLEIEKIFKLDLTSKPTMENTRDLFVLGCATGLRFSDLSGINIENIKGYMLEITPVKTETKIYIPLSEMAMQIIHKYDYVLPKPISNQNFNLLLKEIGKLAQINTPIPVFKKVGKLRTDSAIPKYEKITSHTARRSFATNCYMDEIPPIEIMKMTGHKTEAAFLKYIRITQEQAAKKLAKHPRFSSKKNNLKIV
jgi:site-specific recombinase XerD